MKKIEFKGPMNEIECQHAFDEWYRENIENAPTVYVHKQTIEMLQNPDVWEQHEKERGDNVGCLYVSMGAFAFPNFERNKEGDWPGVRAIIVGELPNGN